MNNYTLKQKADAFDKLWNNCGLGRGILHYWANKDISRPGCPPNEATILRVPVYEFRIMFEGDCNNFKDVLHKLATS